VAVLLVAGGALAFGVVDDGPARATEDRVQAIAETIQCPQCEGQSAADSDAAAAQAVRAEIGERLEAGQSAAEIRDYFASRFGEEILLTPPSSGPGSLVWILPVVAFVCGAAGLAYAFWRWRRT
jgi:cytochrome c-type biogenesis protein CcmH